MDRNSASTGNETDNLITGERATTPGEPNKKIVHPQKGHALIRLLPDLSLRLYLSLMRQLLCGQELGYGLARREFSKADGGEKRVRGGIAIAGENLSDRVRLEDLRRALAQSAKLFL